MFSAGVANLTRITAEEKKAAPEPPGPQVDRRLRWDVTPVESHRLECMREPPTVGRPLS